MAEAAKLGRRHSDDPSLERREEVRRVEAAKLSRGRDEAVEELGELFVEFLEHDELRRERVQRRVFLRKLCKSMKIETVCGTKPV